MSKLLRLGDENQKPAQSALESKRPLARGDSAEERRELLVRLVRYLQESPYLREDTVIYKGGLFLGEHTGVARYTQDVDISIITASVYLRVKKVLQAFGELLVHEGAIASYAVADEVLPGKSGGATFRAKSGSVLFSVDISLQGEIPLDRELVNTNIAGTLYLTTLEQVLCDKISVLYSRSRFRRAKDLYDVWLILTTVGPDTSKLRDMLYERRLYPLPLDKAPFRDDCVAEMEHAYNRFLLLDPTTGTPRTKPSFKDVVTVVGPFLARFMEDDT